MSPVEEQRASPVPPRASSTSALPGVCFASSLDRGPGASFLQVSPPRGEPAIPQASRDATGNLCSSGGKVTVTGWGEHGRQLNIPAQSAPCHKPLVSAAQIATEGYMHLMHSTGGWTIKENSTAGRHIRNYIDWYAYNHPLDILWPLYQECGVYMSYMQNKHGEWKGYTLDSGCSHTVIPNGAYRKKIQPDLAAQYAKQVEDEVRKRLSGESRQETHP